MEITGWVIEYWDGSPSHFSSLDGDWEDAPDNNVIFIWFFLGPYTIRLHGTDHYSFDNGAFSGFDDSTVSDTSADNIGGSYQVINDELIRVDVQPVSKTPRGKYVKHGVYVPEPHASSAGLTKNSVKRMAPELRQYT